MNEPIKYSFSNNLISYNTQQLKVVYYSDTLLIVEENFHSDDISNQPERWFLFNQDYLIKKYLNELGDLSVVQNDTLRIIMYGLFQSGTRAALNQIENYKPTPTFSSKISFAYFIQEHLPSNPKLEDGNYAKFSFTVLPNGSISGVYIIEGSNKKLNENLLKTLSRPDNTWTPAHYKGKAVSTKMIFPLFVSKGGGLESETKSMVRTNKLLLLADKLYSENKFEQAIKVYDESIKLNPNPDAIFNRAAAYLQLNNIEKACKDWMSIYMKGENTTYQYLVEYCKF